MRILSAMLLVQLFASAGPAPAQPVRIGDTVRLNRPNSSYDLRLPLGQVVAVGSDSALVDLLAPTDPRAGSRSVAWSGIDMCIDRHRQVGRGLVLGAVAGAVVAVIANQAHSVSSSDWYIPPGEAALGGAAIGGYFGIKWGFNRRIGFWSPVVPSAGADGSRRRVKCGYPSFEISIEKEWEKP